MWLTSHTCCEKTSSVCHFVDAVHDEIYIEEAHIVDSNVIGRVGFSCQIFASMPVTSFGTNLSEANFILKP